MGRREARKREGEKARRKEASLAEMRLTLILRSRQLAQALLGRPLNAMVFCLLPSTLLPVCGSAGLTFAFGRSFYFRLNTTAQEQMRQVHRES